MPSLLFLLCLPPFIRTKRRFVGFSGETSFLLVTAAKFSLFPLASIESGLKKKQRIQPLAGKLWPSRSRFAENLVRYYEARAFSCRSAEKRECGQRNNNTSVLLTH